MIFSVFYECHLDPGEWALRKPAADRVTAKPDNNHELTDTGFLGATHDMFQQWLALYLNQRLGNCARRRDEAAAVTGGQNQALVYSWHLSLLHLSRAGCDCMLARSAACRCFGV